MPVFPFRKGYEGNIRVKAGQGTLPDTGDAVSFGMLPQVGKCHLAGKITVKGDESQNLNRCHMNMIFYFVMVPGKGHKKSVALRDFKTWLW